MPNFIEQVHGVGVRNGRYNYDQYVFPIQLFFQRSGKHWKRERGGGGERERERESKREREREKGRVVHS